MGKLPLLLSVSGKGRKSTSRIREEKFTETGKLGGNPRKDSISKVSVQRRRIHVLRETRDLYPEQERFSHNSTVKLIATLDQGED